MMAFEHHLSSNASIPTLRPLFAFHRGDGNVVPNETSHGQAHAMKYLGTNGPLICQRPMGFRLGKVMTHLLLWCGHMVVKFKQMEPQDFLPNWHHCEEF